MHAASSCLRDSLPLVLIYIYIYIHIHIHIYIYIYTYIYIYIRIYTYIYIYHHKKKYIWSYLRHCSVGVLFTKFEHMCSDSLHMCISTHVHWYTYVLNLVNKQLHYSITYELIYMHYSITYEQIYSFFVVYIHIYTYVTLSHLRSKGNAIAYVSYCTGSGMLTRYTHWYRCVYLVNWQVNEIYALISVHISR